MSSHPFLEYLVALEAGDDSTHKSYINQPGNWKVPDGDLADFWVSYCRSVLKHLRQGRTSKLSLAEQPVRYPPVMSDMVFKFPANDDPSTFTPYDESFVLSVVRCYQDVILDLIEPNEGLPEILCCVLEQTKITEEDGNFVCKLRLQFPYCKISAKVQVATLVPMVISKLGQERVLTHLWTEPTGNLEEIVNSNAVMEPHLMYLSVKDYTDVPLQLTKIYGYITDDDLEDGEAKVFSLSESFVPRNHEHVHRGLLPIDVLDNQDITFWTPLFLSLGHWTKQSVLKKGKDRLPLSKSFQKLPDQDGSRSDGGLTDLSKEDDKLKAKRFLKMLSPERAEEEHFCKDVGQVLYKIYDGKTEGFHVWSSWVSSHSHRSKSRAMDGHTMMTASDCKEYWGDLDFQKDFTMTLRTVAWYAHIDSPKAYKQWHTKWVQEAMDQSLNLKHVDVAEVLYRLKWLNFTCAAVGKKCWYEFKRHRWYPLDNASEVEYYLTHSFRDIYRKYNLELMTKVNQINNESEKKVLESMSVQVIKLVDRLGTSGFANSTIRMAQNIFHHYDPDFIRFRDKNPDVLGMENCVIQTAEIQAIVRDGKPEDYVTKSTGLRWNDQLHEDHPAVKAVDLWFHQMFPDPELCRYAWKIDASCLQGGNSEKIFPCNCGEGGDNSKSMKKKLMECAWEPYCVNFDTSLFTSTRRGSGPTPELARTEGARVGFVDEPKYGMPYDSNLLKKLTGRDTISARRCGEDGGDIEMSVTIFMNCNQPPSFDTVDRALENRFRYVPFLGTWVPAEEAPKTMKEQFETRLYPMDPHFDRKIPKMAPAYVWRLVHWYAIYRKEGLKTPKIVMDYSKRHWEENCPYNLFIKEEIEQVYITGADGKLTNDENSKLTCKEIYTEFVDWFKECKPSDRIPDYSTALAQFRQKFGSRPIDNCWGGIRFRTAMAKV